MKFVYPEADAALFAKYLQELSVLSTNPLNEHGRPCAHCSVTCHQCHSTRCQCNCHPNCNDARSALSIEGKHLPIESSILPLVYSLNRLRVFMPYWSCEGHVSPQNELIRCPQVWFHCRSLVCVRLLGDWLNRQFIDKKIQTPWRIALTFSGPTLDTGFCLQPDNTTSTTLTVLQQDAAYLGEVLVDGVSRQAAELSSEFKHYLR